MDDYISRKAAVNALTKVALCVAASHRRAVATCINGIELLPAADVELVRRWIPVGKRLPKDCGEYLVRANSERFPGVKYTGICLYCNDNKTWYSDHSHVEGVTHWMPLPEPPGEEQNEGFSSL